MSELIGALKGALDYTRLYRDQTFVIKIGGEILSDPERTQALAQQLALLESISVRVILVHGGGPQATDLARELGHEPQIIAGRRVTCTDTLQVAKMVFAGTLNVDILAALRSQGVRAVGLSGVDGELVTARRRQPVSVTDDDGDTKTVDFGHVGDIESVDPTVLHTLLEAKFMPVVASLAADRRGHPLNVNADGVAQAIASQVNAQKLIFLTNSPGLLRDPEDPDSLVAFADPTDLDALSAAGAISGGMRPKLDACIRAVRNGVRRTHIIDGRRPDALLIELFTGSGCGTMIVDKKEKQDYSAHELETGAGVAAG